MIGGTVINTEVTGKLIRIDIVEDRGKDCSSVFTPISHAAKCIEDGDAVFYNDNHIYWTPRLRCWHDYKMDKVGKAIIRERKEELIGTKGFQEKEK